MFQLIRNISLRELIIWAAIVCTAIAWIVDRQSEGYQNGTPVLLFQRTQKIEPVLPAFRDK